MKDHLSVAGMAKYQSLFPDIVYQPLWKVACLLSLSRGVKFAEIAR
jgi:hypothetical protein